MTVSLCVWLKSRISRYRNSLDERTVFNFLIIHLLRDFRFWRRFRNLLSFFSSCMSVLKVCRLDFKLFYFDFICCGWSHLNNFGLILWRFFILGLWLLFFLGKFLFLLSITFRWLRLSLLSFLHFFNFFNFFWLLCFVNLFRMLNNQFLLVFSWSFLFFLFIQNFLFFIALIQFILFCFLPVPRLPLFLYLSLLFVLLRSLPLDIKPFKFKCTLNNLIKRSLRLAS